MSIEWRKVKSNKNYEISTEGQVMSLYNNKLLKIYGKRPTVKLYTTPKTCEERYVDQLLCEAFYPFIYNGQPIKHINGDIKNCTKANLRFKQIKSDDRQYFLYYELEKRGKIRVWNPVTKDIFELKSAEEFNNTDRIFYVLDPFRKFDENYYFDDECLKTFATMFHEWCNELETDKDFKIMYNNYYTHNTAVTLTFKRLANKVYESFERIKIMEHMLHGMCFNGGLQRLVKKYVNQEIQCYTYDFSAKYPSIMSSDEFLIPITKPKGYILTDIPTKFELGIYHVNIKCKDKNFRKIFSFSKNDYYTNISLNFALKYKERFGITIEFIQDGDQNAFIYDKYVKGSEIFGTWFEQLIKLKQKYPKNGLVKHLTSSLWGHIIHPKVIRAKPEDLDKYKNNDKFALKDMHGKVDRTYDFYDLDNLYNFNIRIKPFVTSQARCDIAEVILDGDNMDYFVRAQTDSATFTREIDYKKFTGLRPEEKSTGMIHWTHVNCYRKLTMEEQYEILKQIHTLYKQTITF